ncbi:MAG: DUF1801 domain-containing protein [Pseudomonadota bacterium]
MNAEEPVFEDPEVAKVFASFPPGARAGLLVLRNLILRVAAETDGVGTLQETLKWGQPAYLTVRPRSGSTLRLGVPKTGGFAIYAHCQTTIISEFRDVFPADFAYDGNRAVLFRDGERPDTARLEMLVRRGLTYHLKS